jgi:hypothetical protein
VRKLRKFAMALATIALAALFVGAVQTPSVAAGTCPGDITNWTGSPGHCA